MKFVVGKKLEDNVIVLEGENAGIYETNMDFEIEDYEVLGFENSHIVFETSETLDLIDQLKQSFDDKNKLYTRCFRMEGDRFNVRGIDEIKLSNGKTVREVIKGTNNKQKK